MEFYQILFYLLVEITPIFPERHVEIPVTVETDLMVEAVTYKYEQI
jgi:hypothetical protein